MFKNIQYNLRQKFLLMSFLLVLVPTIILGYLAFNTFKKEIFRNTEKDLQLIVRGWRITAEVYIEQLNRLLRREEVLVEKRLRIIVRDIQSMFEVQYKSSDGVVSESDRNHLLNKIKELRIGRSGFAFVLDSAGDFILPKNAEHMNKNMFNLIDEFQQTPLVVKNNLMQSIIENPGNVFVDHFLWKDGSYDDPRMALVAFVHYPQENLILGAMTYYTDFKSYNLKRILQDELRDKIAQQRIGDQGYIWVINSRGEYVVSKDRLRDGENVFNERDGEGKLFVQEIIVNAKSLRGKESYAHYYRWKNIGDDRDNKKVAVISYVRGWDWIIGASAYHMDFLKGLRTINGHIIRICIFAIIFGGIIAYIFVLFITRPIRGLEQLSKEAAKGNLDIIIDDHLLKRNDEIGSLAHAFQTMIISLNEKIKEIESSRQVLLATNAQLEEATINIERNEKKFRTLFETANDAIFLFKGVSFVDFNKRAEQMFCCSRQQLLSSDIFQLSLPKNIKGIKTGDIFQDRINQALTRGYDSFEWECRRFDGKGFEAEISLNTLELDGHIYIQAIIRDITERKQIENEIKKANEDLAESERKLKLTLKQTQEMHEELKMAQNQLIQSEKLASIGQLAAGVAHEINNPLGFISSNMETLEFYIKKYNVLLNDLERVQEVGSENTKEIDRILSNIVDNQVKMDYVFVKNDVLNLLDESKGGLDRIRRIVLDLRNFSSEGKNDFQKIDIHEVLDGVINIVYNEIKYKAELVKEYSDVPQITGNSQRLGQVFINLLLNAAQAIESRGKIIVKLYCDKEYVYVAVNDNGSGISEEHLNKIFEAFFTTKPFGQGTGLGLSISYEVIKQHAGEITVESQLGKGTTFVVKLPI